ncbi:MAG: phytoene/squalene synthase family protein [Wenzhouxiangellaceae bacterium]
MDQASLGRRAEQTIAVGSKSFASAARLFRPAMRRDVMLLYTWCRHCDDVTDGQQLGHGRGLPAEPKALAALKQNSLDALAGQPLADLAWQALAEVGRRHDLSPALIEDHLKGFELDAHGWRPDTFEQTLEYCYFVAGAVGIMMARIMAVRDHDTLLRACDLGMGFQLTNIARDIVEDARVGRCYLPGQWLDQAGLTVDELARTDRQPAVYPLACHLVAAAEPYYRSADVGIVALPARAGWAIATASDVYRDIGRTIASAGPQVLGRRVSTARSKKLWRIMTGAGQILAARFRRTPDFSRTGLWTPDAERSTTNGRGAGASRDHATA